LEYRLDRSILPVCALDIHLEKAGLSMKAKQRERRVTLLDVAHEAGVSRATASLVLRNSPQISSKTKRRVEATMERLGYVYNMAAAGMRAARSKTVGVIVPNLDNPFFGELLSGIESNLNGAGLVVVLANSQESVARQDAIMLRMRERGVDGLVVCPAAQTRPVLLKNAAAWGLPLVQALRYVSDSKGDYAGVDYAGGMRQAVDHLFGLGHRRIAFVAAGPMHSAHRERLDGFRGAKAARGLDVDIVIEAPLSPVGAAAFVDHVLEHPGRPTAAICFNDIVAGGLSSGLLDRGLVPGKDFSIVGFDGLPQAEMIRPRLTSVAAFPKLIGEMAAQLLRNRIDEPDSPFRRIVNVTELMARQSSGPVSR
jgi:LacI family transcriptional regulator